MRKREVLKLIIFSKLVIFLILGIIFLVIFISAMRNNYSEMVKLREAVKVADEKNGDIEKALQNLREHVHSHMNTDLSSGPNAITPPIQLKFEYERIAKTREVESKKINTRIAKEAESICASKFPAGGINPPRVACIQDYVASNSVEANPVEDDLYKFDFVSPKWSPDLAGFSLIAMLVSLGVFILGSVYKIIKRYHY